jgi:haloacetate dehalogenase
MPHLEIGRSLTARGATAQKKFGLSRRSCFKTLVSRHGRRPPANGRSMSDLTDLFPGFASHWIDAEAGKIFARSGGCGPAVALLHGFGETHVAWRLVAAGLAKRFSVVALDLRGYGWSSAPESSKGAAYTKRAMAADVINVMEQLGHAQFALVGHDRGARVGLRLSLDHPGRLSKLALLSIAPLAEDFGDADLQRIGRAKFLASEEPKPENLIALDPIGFLEEALKSGTKSKSLDPFGAQALAHYRAAFNEPSRIHAFCEDFRAGDGEDRELLLANQAAGEKIAVPTLVLWGEASFPGDGPSLLDAWRDWAVDLRGAPLDSGHYLAEEAPETTLAQLEAFL